MAGPKTTQFLAPADYQTFYQLVHRLSEETLVHLISISTQAYVLKVIIQTTPHDSLLDPVQAPQIESMILQLHTSAKNMTEEVRRFFWPRLAHEGGSHDINQKRWAPYDESAWDKFFADFVRFVKPRLQTLEILSQQLERRESYGGILVKQDGSRQSWRLSDYLLQEPYQQLNFLLTESGFEMTLFAE